MNKAAAPSGAVGTSVRGGRDSRIDVLRGLALITIFVDHVPGNLYSYYTFRMIGFSDAAEAFVLISGIAAGLAYSRHFQPGKTGSAIARILRRARTIYLAHIFASLAAAVMIVSAWHIFGLDEFMASFGLKWLLQAPAAALAGLMLLTYQISYFNILPLYVVLFLFLPGLLLLGTCRIWLMLACSAALWLVARYFGLKLPSYPGEYTWFFNPLCWQFLFAIGLAVGIAAKKGRVLVGPHPALLGAAAAFIVFAAWWRLSGEYAFPWPDFVPDVLADTSKQTLGPARILHILAVAYILSCLPFLRRLFETKPFYPVMVMGQASLVTFVSGSLIAVVFQILRVTVPFTLLADTLLLLAGLSGQFLLAQFLLRRSGRLLPFGRVATA